jgi:hypothetical protein
MPRNDSTDSAGAFFSGSWRALPGGTFRAQEDLIQKSFPVKPSREALPVTPKSFPVMLYAPFSPLFCFLP